MADTTKSRVEKLEGDVTKLTTTLGQLADAHNTLVKSHNRMTAVLEQLGKELAGGLSSTSLSSRAIIMTISETLDRTKVLPLAEWQAVFELNYERVMQQTADAIAAEATIETAVEPEERSNIIVP